MSDETTPRDYPQWMTDCIDHFVRTQGRGPNLVELLMWREAEASCRMERDE